jgi:DNA-binding MarR family transcriptional regulator
LPKTKTYTMETSPGYQLMMTSRVHEARIEKALDRLGITRAEFTVLYAIDRGRRAPADIVGFLDVRTEGVETTVNKLTDNGLIEPTGRASGEVQVTDLGRTVLSDGISAAVEANARIRAALTPEEQELFVDLMARIRDGESVRRAAV